MFRSLMNSPWLYFSLAAFIVVLAVLSQFELVAKEAPPASIQEIAKLGERDDLNLVFIVIDTLRADRLHTYGYKRENSPNLDALAARAIRFANVEAQSSWTKASMASLWTSLYPERTGIKRFPDALPEDAVLPAEILKEAGYRTAGLWRNGWLANNFGFDQGFDLYYRPLPNRPAQALPATNPSGSRISGTDLDATEAALEFLLGNKDSRFFLYIHYMDVHQYLSTTSSPSYGTGFSDSYDSAIHWTDENIGAIVKALYSHGLLEKTMIVVAADHGEAFFEHGSEGHARNLYREVQHVPLMIVPPFTLQPGVVVEENVANVDIWPTLLDLMGLPSLPGAEGRSLVPLILEAGGMGEAPAELKNRKLFSQIDRTWGRQAESDRAVTSILEEPYRYIVSDDDSEPARLYDRSADPLEKHNIADTETALVEGLEAALVEFRTRPIPAWSGSYEIELDELQRGQLRALGYAITMDDDPPDKERPEPPGSE